MANEPDVLANGRPLSIFCDDGYTCPGEVPEIPGQAPAFTIEFRPTLIEPRLKWDSLTRFPSAQAQYAKELVFDYVDSFTIHDPGKPKEQWEKIKPTIDQTARIWGGQLMHCVNYILGFIPPTIEDKEKN